MVLTIEKLAIKIRCTGRMPVTIEGFWVTVGWLKLYSEGPKVVGISLPHRLDAGSSQDWALDKDEVVRVVRHWFQSEDLGFGRGQWSRVIRRLVQDGLFNLNVPVRVFVVLGDGRRVRCGTRFTVGAVPAPTPTRGT